MKKRTDWRKIEAARAAAMSRPELRQERQSVTHVTPEMIEAAKADGRFVHVPSKRRGKTNG